MKKAFDMTKDEMRLERSIQKMLSRSDSYFERCRLYLVSKERAFEQYCYDNNLLYSPLNICL